MQLSGYFEENTLNRHVVYPNGTTNIINEPTWEEQSGAAEDVAYIFFDAFKEISTENITSNLGLNTTGVISQGRGKEVVHTRNGEYLGNKIYNILKPSGMSYSVVYDFVNNKRKFEIWEGLDCTQNNADGNNPVVFSTKYGNIKEPNVLISETDHRNACIVTNEQVNGETSKFTSRAVFGEPDDTGEYRMMFLKSGLDKSKYTASAFSAALDNEAVNALDKTPVIINVEFDAAAGSYEYMKDFDIGYKCSIEIAKMSLSADARLIGCYEVMKSGKWIMTMEFGEPILKGGIY